MSDEIWSWVLRLGALVLFVGGAWGLAHLVRWLAAKAKTSRVYAAFHQVAILVDGVLSDVATGIRPDIDAAAADGKVTPEERKLIGAKALDLTKKALGQRGLTQLSGMLGIGGAAIETWLSGVVQDRLSVKMGTVPVPPIAVTNAPAAPVPR